MAIYVLTQLLIANEQCRHANRLPASATHRRHRFFIYEKPIQLWVVRQSGVRVLGKLAESERRFGFEPSRPPLAVPICRTTQPVSRHPLDSSQATE